MTTIKGLSPRERDKILQDLQAVRHTELMVRIDPDEPARQAGLSAVICGCGEHILIQPGRVSESTKTVCPDCAEAIIAEAKANGREVTVVRGAKPPRVYRAQDGKTYPIEVRTRMPIDLSTISDAELGAITRQRMLEQKLAVMETEVPKAIKAQAKKDRKAEKAHKKARAITHDVLPEIVVSEKLTIPALDVNEVTSLDDVVPAVLRSPYNKALYKLGSETLPPETTYATLLGTHRAVAAAMAEYKPRAKKGEPEAGPEVDPTDQDEMVTAIMAALDCSEKAARKHLKKFLKEMS